MTPPRSILDPEFRYTRSEHTDIRKTFERVRREMAKKPANVAPIRRKKA